MRAATEMRENSDKVRDAAGFAFLGMAIMMFLALLTYSPNDAAVNTIGGEARGNWISLAGAYLADILTLGLGYSSYLLPLGLVVLSLVLFSGRNVSYRLDRLVGFGLLLVAGSSMFAVLSLGRTADELVIRKGGLLGWVVASQLYPLFGKVGVLVLLTTVVLVALVWVFDFSPLVLLKALVAGGGRVASFARTLVAGADASLKQWRRDRALLREKGDEPTIHDEEKKEDRDATVVQVHVNYEDPPLPPELDKEAESKSPEASAQESLPLLQNAAGLGLEPTIRRRADVDQAPAQSRLLSFSGTYRSPPLDLLEDYRGINHSEDRESLLVRCGILEKKLADFGVQGRVSDVHPGPVITTFEFEPASGVKVNRVANLEDDLAMVLRAESIRIVAPIPGKGAVGIEVPNRKRETIYLRGLIESAAFQTSDSPLTVAFGKNVNGHAVVQDLAKMPHLLVAGTTGSGKSVFINSIITSILYKSSPEQVKLILIDPKMLELSDYADIPHLLCPVCTQPKKAANILRWTVSEMERRYARMRDLGVRNISNYNRKVERMRGSGRKARERQLDSSGEALNTLPYIVVIIDELADLMMISPKDLEESIARLAQMARAAGIHLILATQRPSVDVITGVIKNNLPARISFRVSAKVDSRTILDTQGAHTLLGDGDMLFLPPTSSRIERIHGCWISEEEVQKVVEYIKRYGQAIYDEGVVAAANKSPREEDEDYDSEEVDPVFDQAVEVVARDRKASVSYIQRCLKIGYNRSARIIERMEREGMIGPSDGSSKPREILLPSRGDA